MSNPWSAMNATVEETFWEDLLTYIEDGSVIPVIGQGALTFGNDDQPFQPWLARKLAAEIGVPLDPNEATPTLNGVVAQHLLRDGDPNLPYLRLHQLLRRENPQPGPTLQALAGITDFRLFLSTTCDPLLARAIELVRLGGQPLASVGAFSPKGGNVDLPCRLAELRGAHVHHLLGKSSSQPNYVLWEEDALEFVCELQRRLKDLDHLARDLQEKSLLVLGLNFSDWLVRFFFRIAKQRRLSQISDHFQYLAEGPPNTLPESMIFFFGGFLKKISVIPSAPATFLAELARRWQARHPQGEETNSLSVALPAERMARGDIFLSYAREDEKFAWQLKAGLERAGCRVWFDRERLKPGVRWHAHLEDAVKHDCSLFISIISKTTESTGESYYHLERSWAAERLARFAEDEEFYIPVIVDDVSMEFAHEPRAIRKIQAVRLPAGTVTEDFGKHLHELQRRRLTAPH